ncbi:MAG: BamA/TamA family outer membrane protein [Gemmatimonadota bacterium]|nr:BamA/TamA family outer membrane protein [Gemmatimonadota bacterium]MDE3126858.1 BamA/TamA family outer membrane protein [Gemmatimonadota bacterium]MDE3174415.1 BamA/TamA family outer membrane protein [Gemmatimonadota bacterium]MDE3214988.1 BamA/TamA family outer membrane protein [Gemmatimonadota bacterium]
MRRILLALAVTLTPLALRAQQPDTTPGRSLLPRDVERDAVRVYNAPGTTRAAGPYALDSGRVVTGDLAVLGGPVTVAGRVAGTLLVINGDAALASTARVDGDVVVVGGSVRGLNRGYVGGEIRIYRDRLRYTRTAQGIAIADSSGAGEPWWRRFDPHRTRGESKFQVASAGAYNRVEGLAVDLGPRITRNFTGGSARLDAYAVVRTASSFRARGNDVGDNLHGEVRFGTDRGVLVGAGVYDLVAPVEAWGVSSLETGLAAALFRRDYRDYFGRHGGGVQVGLFSGQQATFTLSYAAEHWTPRAAANAWTLFRSDAAWRPNPLMDDARLHLLNATLRLDTRTDELNPWSGWYLMADFEHGTGHLDSLGTTSVPRTYPAGRAARYDRGFVDVRRYNRVSRDAQLNLRLVAGGWLDGDPLPLERRLSADGYDALPGFGFRQLAAGRDVASCAASPAPAGMPAQCDRIALAQAEYRSELHFRPFDWAGDDWVVPHFRADGTWVVFVDAGRGWRVGDPAPPMTYRAGALPALSTFRTDAGVGLDFDGFGVYVAKALSAPGQPARAFIRLQHRF